MRKKGLECYLIISSIIAIIIIIGSSVTTVLSNPVIKQNFQQGTLLDLIEMQSRGLLELDDLFDDIFD
ncbi:MAG: hypothetical protein J6D33_05595 [Turicibacter sp.]|nr:hypothetical protein [Turicibacter sp.]